MQKQKQKYKQAIPFNPNLGGVLGVSFKVWGVKLPLSKAHSNHARNLKFGM